jgi:hypothetical protein
MLLSLLVVLKIFVLILALVIIIVVGSLTDFLRLTDAHLH